MAQEWSDKYNPFNSDKLLAHVDRWKQIKRGQPIPPPTTVSIDPINLCDLRCIFCNADFVIDENKGSRLEEDVMQAIPNFLAGWNDGVYGVRSVCVGGGGEPLLNKHVGTLMDRLIERGIGVGIVTDGTQIHRYLESLSRNTFVSVSVDTDNKDTYKRMKEKDKFDQVIENIRALVDYSRTHKSLLADRNASPGIAYNFLLHPYNVKEVIGATRLAKEIGCDNIHIRPVCVPWFELDKGESPHTFKPEHVEKFNRQIAEAMKLEDERFKVYGVTHKYNPDFSITHHFESCYAIFMNGVIMPPSDRNKGNGKLDWGTCCDRRGDDLVTVKNLTALEQIKEFWGSDRHWKIHDDIKVKYCPRCTFEPHNRIQENVVLRNGMNYDFI